MCYGGGAGGRYHTIGSLVGINTYFLARCFVLSSLLTLPNKLAGQKFQIDTSPAASHPSLNQVMMCDQRDSDAEESIDEPEENEEVNESDHDEYSSGDDTRSLLSDDDSGEENIDSDDDDDDDSEGLTLEEMRKFICTFTRGNYEDKIENALGRGADRLLSTTANAVIGLYNKPADWMERNAVGLENLKEQLQQCIRMAEDGKSFSIVLEQMQRYQSDAPVVWHDPSINPYWEKLTTACRNRTRESLRIDDISIVNVEMRKETVAALLASLHGGIWISPPQPNNNHSICRVNFANTNLCGESLVSLSSFVEQSPSLRLVRLSHNRIGGMNLALRLSRALKPHPNMIMLIMTHCDLGNDPDILSVILQSDVKEIDLSHNYIDSLGGVKISEYLVGRNPPVKSLSLDYN